MFSKDIRMVENGSQDERGRWKLFLNGDLQAWEQIFKLFYKDLYGYGLKLSAQPELTKDSIHELFVELWDRRNNLDEAVSVKAYLLASLRRRLLKKVKRKRKYYTDLESIEANFVDKIQFSPEELIIKNEIRSDKFEALYDAIDALPDRQKEVLYLKYFNGMSYDEIETILSINYQSIRNHIHRAIKRLREIMGENISEIAIYILPALFSLTIWVT